MRRWARCCPPPSPTASSACSGGPNYRDEADAAIVWEHGRRNFGLRDEGVLAVVLPITDESGVSGAGVFAATVEETVAIMDGDPGVVAGVFTYRVQPCLGFPGDALR